MQSALSLALVLLAAIVPDTSAASAGCGKDPVESGEKTANVNGKDRQYILQVPSNYNPETPYKLIFGYHWLGGTKDNVAPGYYGLRDIAAESAIFVAPQGLDNGWGNAGGEDILFTDQMIATIEEELCVDETQIFATGFSYGGAMSYSLACSRADVIRSVAVIAGATLSGCDGGTTPVPYLGIHGVVDSVLNIGMGRELRDKYLQLNGCQAKEAEEPQAGSGSHIKTEYECEPGYPVWWIAHSGDHVGDPKDGNGDYWAPRETWAFWTEAIGGGGNGTSF